jgi:dUTPase
LVFQRVERASLVEIEEASPTPRGVGGFGSTGRRGASAKTAPPVRRGK